MSLYLYLSFYVYLFFIDIVIYICIYSYISILYVTPYLSFYLSLYVMYILCADIQFILFSLRNHDASHCGQWIFNDVMQLTESAHLLIHQRCPLPRYQHPGDYCKFVHCYFMRVVRIAGLWLLAKWHAAKNQELGADYMDHRLISPEATCWNDGIFVAAGVFR